MKILRFSTDGREAWGLLEEGGMIREATGDPFTALTGGQLHALDGVRLLAPVRPGKIIALGLNYREHIRELGHEEPAEPVIFLKPPSALVGPGETIRIPPGAGRVDYEAELALVIRRRARCLTPGDALDAVLGVTCFNDVTARDLQRRDGQWTRAKSFDTFAPLGPWIETDEPSAPRAVESLVNGELRQKGSTADLIFDLRSILVFVSGIMTLDPGDVIATGTPPGVGPLSPGDKVEIRISGIGTLENNVA